MKTSFRLLCCGLLLLPISSFAVNVNVSVHIVAAPCKINDGQSVDVDFGDIGINKVDGNNYRRELPYTMDCDSNSGNIALVMQGTPVAFDSDAATINSSLAGLGVKFWLDDQAFKINTPAPVSPTALPKLYAAPFKDTSATLSSGDFAATATLVAIYQ
ncbi:MAG: fimbrial protein [Scandinavium sp.]|uniref:fimbrial protein n=1 Tax=Scandinavium sp. TaxID=2830653 RepID=UPI003F3EAE23